MWNNFLQNVNKSRGQNIVEYGLIIALIAIITIQIIDDTNNKTRALIQNIVGDSYNENQISLDLPDIIEEWDEKENLTNPPPRPPVAFFSVTNPVYGGDEVKFWDGSFDPDGDSLTYDFRSSSMSLNFTDTFSFPIGEHDIMLKVTDSTGMWDIYRTTLYVEERKPYTKIMTIQKTPDSEPVGTPNIIEKNPEDTIIDHQFGERTDLHGINHIVIEKNYIQTTTYRELDQTYQVTVPKYEVTFDGNGNILNTRLIENIQYTESVINPYPAKIESEWEDNTWTFYVYEEISSVKNQVMLDIGAGPLSPSADYPRFAKSRDATEPDTMETAKEITQDPARETSRDSKKKDEILPAGKIPSIKDGGEGCATCSDPNRFTLHNETQHRYDTFEQCSGTSGDGTTTLSNTPSIASHDRVYNWVEHQSYDLYYKYSGTGESTGSKTDKEEPRNSDWTTEGWVADEMVGNGTYTETRAKYTSCDGDGWSEDCWNPLTEIDNNAASNRYIYDRDTGCSSGEIGSYEKVYYKKSVLKCKWEGGDIVSSEVDTSTDGSEVITDTCEDISDVLEDLLVNQLGVDESLISSSATFMDLLGSEFADSTTAINRVESKFGISISTSDAEGISTFNDLVTYIEDNI